MSTIQFLGAARNVTGSRFVIEHEGKKILIDCGYLPKLVKEGFRNPV
jgi:metallo-beta-lactamase family protein